MLVTLAILGLAAGVAVQFAGGSGRRVQRLSEVVAGEIGLLRAEALRSGTTTRLALDPDSGWFLSSRVGAVPIPTAPLPVHIEPNEIGAGAPAEIRFLPDGGSSGGRIILGPPGAGVVLSVGTLTARVHREAVR